MPEPRDGAKEKDVLLVTRRGVQQLEAEGASTRPELGREQVGYPYPYPYPNPYPNPYPYPYP